MNPGKTNPEKTIVKDPVCNMDVDPANARGSAEYKGQTYYFCSPGCVTRFNADPEKYLAPKTAPAELPKTQLVQIGKIIPSARRRSPNNKTCTRPISREGNCHLRLPHGP